MPLGFRNLDRIVDLYAEVTNGALDLRVTEQKLDRTQISSSAVDQSRFGPPQGVSAELQRV